MLSSFIKQHHLPDTFEQTANSYYQPIAEQLVRDYKGSLTRVFVGVNGCQGSGKSTLSQYLAAYISEKYQLNVLVMSLDDFYFSSERRKQLAQSIHPLLATRGVPGTHDTAAMADVFQKLANNSCGFTVPKFNKATDEPFEPSQWQQIQQPVDIVIFEGWCWGVKAQSHIQLKTPINALEKTQDIDGIWRSYVNRQLAQNYQPLYQYINYWLVLQAPSFDCVYQWRLEQEHKLSKSSQSNASNNKVMTPAQVLDFIQYFQRLTEHGLNTLSESANGLLSLDTQRNIIKFSVGVAK